MSLPLSTQASTLLRQTIAERIRALRKNKKVWAPMAPRADQRCRRGWTDVEVGKWHSPNTLGDLVAAAEAAGHFDLHAVGVRAELQRVPFEGYSTEVLALTVSERLSDEMFAAQIHELWEIYALAGQKAAGRLEEYQTYLRLKQVFEPRG